MGFPKILTPKYLS